MPNPLVLLLRTDNILEAHIIKGRLKSSGIEAFVFDDQMLSTNWLYSQALGGVRVMVLSSQLDEALCLLKEPTTVDDFEAFDMCPLCHSIEVTRIKPSLLLALLTYFLLNFLHIKETRNRYCRTCGHKWPIKK